MSTIDRTRPPSVKGFVAAAPDARPARRRAEKPEQIQITLLMPPRMLEQVDEVATRRDQPVGAADVLGRRRASQKRPPDGSQESRRTAEFKVLRAELVKRLDRLDFRFQSIGPALAKMARHAERTIRRLMREPDA